MAIFPYREHELAPDASKMLGDISRYSLSTKAMLTALGDYWTNYYRNLDPIASAATGSVAAISKEYTRLLDMVLAANILDIPLRDSSQFDLLVIRSGDFKPVYAKDGSLDYYFLPLEKVVDVGFLCSSLFESRVVLERGKHFEVEHGQGLKFYVDIFGDEGVTGYTYETGSTEDRGLLLWAMDIAFTSSIIYERYGRFLYKKASDGEQYKWAVSALMRFYENAKTVQGIQDVMNIMYGVPYTRYRDERITDIYYVDKTLSRVLSQIEDPFICIETDRATYYTYAFSKLLYKVGDVVPQFSLLADFNRVEDYITKPGWWEDCAFPDTLIAGAATLSPDKRNELMDKVLKYNTVYVNIGVSFDTYSTYLAQVKELFQIIESGFPVYLYPLVDTFFRAVFLDQWEIQEFFDNIRLSMGQTSQYPWGESTRFDGSTVYYMEPSQDHGRKSHCEALNFDGQESYYLPEKHNGCRREDILHFEGEGDYDSDWEKSHAADREILHLSKANLKYSENYPWESSPRLRERPLTYANLAVAGGEYKFGEILHDEAQDPLQITTRFSQISDDAALPEDGQFSFGMYARPLEDQFFSIADFNGLYTYQNLIPGGGICSDELCVRVIHR